MKNDFLKTILDNQPDIVDPAQMRHGNIRDDHFGLESVGKGICIFTSVPAPGQVFN